MGKVRARAVEGAEVCIKGQSYEEVGGFKELEYVPGPCASLLLVFQGTLLVNSGSSTAELHARPPPEKEAGWRRYLVVTQAMQQLCRLLTNGKWQCTRGRRVASAGQGVSAMYAGTYERAEAHSVRRRRTAR